MANDPTPIIVLGEISAVLFLLLIGLLAVLLMKMRKASKLLTMMIKQNMENAQERKQLLHATFNKLPVDGNTLNEIVDELVEQEISFFKQVASAFVDRKTCSIERIDEEVRNLVSPYARLADIKGDVRPQNQTQSTVNEPEPMFDDAINDLLSDEHPASAEVNPEFDISATEQESIADTPDDGFNIAEIPEELLGGDEVAIGNGPQDK